MPWRLCDLPKYPAALTNNRNRLLLPTSVRYFWAQEQQPFTSASQRRPLPGNAHPAPLSPSTSTSLSRPHSNTCCERDQFPLPFTSPGTSTNTSAGIGNAAGGGDDGGSGDDDDDG